MSELQIMIDAFDDDIKFILAQGNIFINEPDPCEDIIQEYLDREEELMILSGGV